MSRVRRDKNTNRTIWLLIVVAVSVFVVVFFAAKGRFTTPISNTAVVTILAPFQRAISWVGYKLHDGGAVVWEVFSAHYQNQLLRNEVVELRQQNMQAAEFAAENIRLKKLLDYKQTVVQFDLVAASVIGRDPDSWTSMILVNKGTAEGIQKNMPVLTENGLVGIVTETTESTAKVQLILDPRCSVGTLVQRTESRVAGIVQGNPANVLRPQMINIPINADVVVGDMIITSGFGNIYPKGIPVGKVAELYNDGGGLLEVAVLETAVDFQKLEDVMIVTSFRDVPLTVLSPPLQTPGTETDAQGNFIKVGQ